MISDQEWRGVTVGRVAEWRAVFQSSREGLDLSAPCPLCGVKALRRWYLEVDEGKLTALPTAIEEAIRKRGRIL